MALPTDTRTRVLINLGRLVAAGAAGTLSYLAIHRRSAPQPVFEPGPGEPVIDEMSAALRRFQEGFES